MAHPVDLHVGQRLRQRRCLLGMTQQRLASSVGIKFQQIQKYESGANRVSASRLWTLATALGVPVSYFFDDMNMNATAQTAEMASGFAETPTANPLDAAYIAPDVFSDKETIDLVRAYHMMKDAPKRRLLDLAKTLASV